MEQLCQILVLADQLLIERLKQICEFHIANLGNDGDVSSLTMIDLSSHVLIISNVS